MCDRIRKTFSSLLFWFVVVLGIFIAMTAYNYTQVETFDWKAAHNLTSLILRGFLLSSIFYFLVVYLPSRKKRKIVKNNFKTIYKGLKKDIIGEILWCSRNGGRTDIDVTGELVEELFDVTKFRDLFKGGNEGDEG